ncbi:MAG TPA: hypothetical protein DIU45_03810, partial [Clostridium sp.]|nr:hypothetical protein [Clostridium sp.]
MLSVSSCIFVYLKNIIINREEIANYVGVTRETISRK